MSIVQQTIKCNGMKVFVTRIVPNIALDILKSAGLEITQWSSNSPIAKENLKTSVQNMDGLYCLFSDQISADVIEAAGSSFKIISTMSVGYEHIDTKMCKSKGIRIGYTPEVLNDDTAELAVALLLATSRRLFDANNALKQGKCGHWSPLCGQSLKDSTVGIVGLGRIGTEIVNKLKGFKIKEFLYTSRQKKDNDFEIGARFVNLNELLKISDFVIVSCSLNNQSKNLFTLDKFKTMKPTSIFVNISRGAVVDQDDLYTALTEGFISSAGLDVTIPEPLPVHHPLLGLSNCVVLPHIGSATISTVSDMARLAAENLVRGLSGLAMPAELFIGDEKTVDDV